MNWLRERLVSAINRSGIKSPAIMLNGEYVLHDSRRVYVSVCGYENDRLRFFTKRYAIGDDSSHTTLVDELETTVVLAGFLRELRGSRLFGFDVGAEQVLENSKIEMKSEHEFICIESELYQNAKKLSVTSGRVVLSVDGVDVGSEQVAIMKKIFLNQSLVSYRNIIYAKGSNRFTKRLTNKNRFYGMKPETFVPVFIDVDGIYNPLRNPLLSAESTLMYKTAIEKGRFVEVSGISAYFLTHKEICQAFGIEHFVRFKPSMWFDIFVGVLQPSNSEFPSSSRELICWEGSMPPPQGLKKVYTENEFTKAVSELGDSYTEELDNYSRMSSLDYYVLQQHSMIRHTGPYYLDSGITIPKLCAYYGEAKLR